MSSRRPLLLGCCVLCVCVVVLFVFSFLLSLSLLFRRCVVVSLVASSRFFVVCRGVFDGCRCFFAGRLVGFRCFSPSLVPSSCVFFRFSSSVLSSAPRFAAGFVVVVLALLLGCCVLLCCVLSFRRFFSGFAVFRCVFVLSLGLVLLLPCCCGLALLLFGTNQPESVKSMPASQEKLRERQLVA